MREKPTLGMVLRNLRARLGMTLKEMSVQSGIPLSTLSKVEHDRLTLTYDKLQQLSHRLHIPMSDIFADAGHVAEPQVTARRSIASLGNAFRVNTPNYDYYFLCTELRRKRMIPIITRIRARSIEEFGEFVRHEGEEWIYVLEGRVVVQTEFYDSVVLGPGESIYLDSTMAHAYLVGDGCEEALAVGVCSSVDEDLMSTLLTQGGKDPAA